MHSTLFLGDSYTIGEGVPLAGSYPYQTIALLRRGGHPFYAPEIIAHTGWTTDELMMAIRRTTLLRSYSYVMLLIGVNNQYRGRDSGEYAIQFAQLHEQACRLAPDPRHIFVLSIPDWGVSPFAADRDRSAIARQIDAFNAIAREISGREGTAFIDITTHSRTTGADPRAFVADGLHPAITTYGHWATDLSQRIIATLKGPAAASESA
ncbi:MAG TPA: GDSL-type esterase/lipase family protein [Puia sp.]|nr:GDSL-type esterase/lipase family protein [Puia sp.]